MSYRASVVRSASFLLLYVAAIVVGTFTVANVGAIRIAWLASGVAAVWWCVQRHAPTRWGDIAMLFVATGATTMALGSVPRIMRSDHG